MKRVPAGVPDAKTNQQDMYEGVALLDLAPNTSGRRVDVFEPTCAFRDRLAVSSTDLDMQSEVIVANTKNGKNLVEHPFCLMTKDNRGDWVLTCKAARSSFCRDPPKLLKSWNKCNWSTYGEP
jgi:hypothetical protein